ncbi:L-ribulose-5-phosphate 3-epimerase [Mesomycoplasma conjunctivae]|uniref:L-ribulose-5-phosphate 3-epimerase n=1 Tax=Mesomycoplasma conjunctivae TaxID=45361 RepID=UPI003DA23E07
MSLKSIENKHFLGIYEKAIDKKFDLIEKIAIAKSAGFDFLELSIDESEEFAARLKWSAQEIKKIRLALIEKDFYFNSMCLSLHRKYPFGSQNPQVRKKALSILEKAMILAKQLGIRTIQLAAYDIYYEQEHLKSEDYFIQTMKQAAKLAQKYSIQIAFETMDTKFAGTISRCLYLINKIGGGVLIYPDLGNLNRFADDIENEIRLAKDKIVGFHFKDTLPNTFKNVDFGQGDVDFVRSLKAIVKEKISAPFLIEMWYKDADFKQELAREVNKQIQIDNLVKARKFFLDKLVEAYNEEK